ncbi:MAG: hypothetical protein FWG68_00350 [Defluviitaleaceae bacterium]|nr:hypothetical protein [Defluviitaleaceae bacterium]
MSTVKERILGAVTVMREEDAVKVWDIITLQFGFEEVEPTEDEIKIITAYNNGNDEYQPYLRHEDLLKELKI